MFPNTLIKFSKNYNISFLIKLPDSKIIKIGNVDDTDVIKLTINNKKGFRAIKSLNELKICEAYIHNDFSIADNTDMLKLLEIINIFSKNHTLFTFCSVLMSILRNQLVMNRANIKKHYEFDDDFYLNFLDKTRCYSHGIFLNEKEPLETASARKLEFAKSACQLVKGSKVLDIGAGWGCSVEYLGEQGINVDAITISDHSENFINTLIKSKGLSGCQIFNVDFFDYKPSSLECYDAIFSLGTLEHLPNYKHVLTKCSSLLKNGGYAYFDASAISSTLPIHSHFIGKHIFPGNHKCLNIFHFLKAVEKSKFDLICLYNDTHNYYLTLKKWAQNLDKHKQEIVQFWGEELYRKFQLYLWGCCFGMGKNQLQAYRIVLKKNGI